MSKHIVFVLKECGEELCAATRMLAHHAQERGCTISVAQKREAQQSGLPLFEADKQAPDVIVTLGGDGTLLRAVRTFRTYKAPFLGIKLGRLGFLTGATLEEATEALDRALDGTVCIEKRNLVEASVFKDGTRILHELALNEVVAGRVPGAPLISTRLKINDHTVYTTSGDGLIISSATGSTAYALSAGGPIMSPEYAGFVVVPLASHTLIQRAIVTAPDEVITLDFPDASRAHVEFSFDGLSVEQVDCPERAEFKVASETIELVKLDSRLFYDTVATEFFTGQQEG